MLVEFPSRFTTVYTSATPWTITTHTYNARSFSTPHELLQSLLRARWHFVLIVLWVRTHNHTDSAWSRVHVMDGGTIEFCPMSTVTRSICKTPIDVLLLHTPHMLATLDIEGKNSSGFKSKDDDHRTEVMLHFLQVSTNQLLPSDS